jgi:hypothetical protein
MRRAFVDRGGLMARRVFDPGKHCGARNRQGEPCTQLLGAFTGHPGVGRCKFHGGRSPGAERTGALSLARAQAQGEARALVSSLVPSGVVFDPIEGVKQAWAVALVMQQIVGSLLEATAVTAAADVIVEHDAHGRPHVRVEGDPVGLVGLTRGGEVVVHPLVEELRKWSAELLKRSDLAVRLGIEARELAVGEWHLEVVERLMVDTLAALKLGPRTAEVGAAIGAAMEQELARRGAGAERGRAGGAPWS